MIWLHITLTEQMQRRENSPFIPTVIELTSFFPWAQPHFIPVYHYDEGHLLLPAAVSPYADFITALSPLQFRLRVRTLKWEEKQIVTAILESEDTNTEPQRSDYDGQADLSAHLRFLFMNLRWGEFLGGPMIRTLCFHCLGCEFKPWLGN